MVRGRHVYSSCIIHELVKKKQRGSENDSCSQERYFKNLYYFSPANNIHNISREYNVITTTCRVYRMLPCPFSMKWVAKHSLPRLRHTNLMLSLWEISQGLLLMTPSPVALTWQQSHSGTVVASHHPVHWLCSMAWCCMVDKHSHRNINSSFKQIDFPVRLHCLHRHGRIQSDVPLIVFGFLCQSSS